MELFIVCYIAVNNTLLKSQHYGSKSQVLHVVSRGCKVQSWSSTHQNMPKEKWLFIQSTFRKKHNIDLTHLVHKNSPRWRQVCAVISTPSGEVVNFFKEFKCITIATDSSKWDKKYMKWQPAISSFISYQKNFTWKITVQKTSWNLAMHYACQVWT
jgi:hypothetical protein